MPREGRNTRLDPSLTMEQALGISPLDGLYDDDYGGGSPGGGIPMFHGGGGSPYAASVPNPVLPLTTSLPAAPAAGGTAGGLWGMGINDWLRLASIAAPLSGRFMGGGNQQSPMAPELRQLLQLQNQRMQQGQPLYDAILKMAMGLLPVSAQAGFGQSAAQRPPIPTPRAGRL